MADTTHTAAVKPAEIEGITEEELAALEPEERAALEDEKTTEKEEKKEEVINTEEDKKEETGNGEQKVEDFGVVDTADSNYRQSVSEVPEFSDDAYKSEVESLAKKYEDGDMTLSEHTIEAGKINARKYDADNYESRRQQADYDAWQADQRAFFASNKRFETSTVLNSALDGEVRRIAATDEVPDTGAELLAMAARNVIREMGIVMAPVESESKRPEAKNLAPTTLSDAPSAVPQDTTKNKFSDLDSLDGMELEAAVSKLSDADRKLFESAG